LEVDHCLFALGHPVARAMHEASDIMNSAYTSLSDLLDWELKVFKQKNNT